MHSITFNSVDLSTYGLNVIDVDFPIGFQADSVQVQSKAYAYDSKTLPKRISMSVFVSNTTLATLLSNLDVIKKTLNEQEDKPLILSSQTDRYWMARLVSMTGNYKAGYYEGSLSFICHDPCAYSSTETDNNTTIDADPHNVTEVVAGSAMAEPVYTLTAGQVLSSVTITVHNHTADTLLSWTGTMQNTDELVIDCTKWLVSLEGSADMASVTGDFPNLLPGVTNTLVVTGFAGTFNTKYRARYI